MPSASVAAFNISEPVAMAGLILALQDALQPRDTNQVDMQAVKLANAISTYVKATMLPPLGIIDVSP